MPVSLIPRADFFRDHPILASVVRSLQDYHDPAAEHNRDYWAGEEEERRRWFEAYRDDIDAGPPPPYGGSLPLSVEADRVEALPGALAAAIGAMMAEIGADTAGFVHVARSAPWTSPREHPRADAANAFFRRIGAGERTGDAIVADRASLGEALEAVFWCGRLDAGYGETYLTLGDAPAFASVCQYGNLHVDVYDAAWLDRLREIAARAGFTAVETPPGCDERFGDGGAIDGRELRMD